MDVPFKIDLSQQTAVVTGGGGVLCGQMAKALAACGAKVAVLSRRQENADKVANEIKEAGHTAVALSCDVTQRDSVEACKAKVEAAFGACTILINGAGGNHPSATAQKPLIEVNGSDTVIDGSFYEMDPEGIRFVVDLNLVGTVIPTQVFSRDMAAAQKGVVINISSMAAYSPLTKVGAYSASKAAIDNFTQWLAVHLAPAGVRVNAIAPGFFVTRQNQALLLQEDGTPTERGQVIVEHTPMRRFGEPDELLGALLWLASPAAAGFVTGAVIPVDGGFSAFSGV